MELFRLLGTIAIDNALANKELDETADKAEKSESKMSTAFKKIGAAAAAAAATATVAVTKMAVESFAEYEQLVGGVQTLFNETELTLEEYAKSVGKSTQEAFAEWGEMTKGARIVMNDAEEAFKTAGMSANEYMDLVTSFSASLIQSLDGNKGAAAEKANKAIIDMADNANKMGTSMEMVQNAYNGFAKGNYTMLDNLKLGYGGTQEEMARLLAKAEELSGIHYDISSYADIVDAIHVIQEEMGIAGATAAEAASTISGSLASAKAAWQNFLTGLADETQDLDVLLQNLTESIVTYGKNLIPRIAQVLSSIFRLVTEKIPVILKEGTEKLAEFSEMALEKAPELIKVGLEMIRNMVKGIMDALPTLIEKVPTILSNFANVINDNAPTIIMAGVGIILDIIKGIIKAIPTLVANIPKIIMAVVNVWEAFNWVNIGKNVIKKIGEGFTKMLSFVKSKATGITDSIKKIFTFDIKLPHIKLPHFAITPSGWGLGDLLKGKIPKLGIEWYAKGGVFDEPTIFPTTSGLKGVGEAGAEAVAPISVLQSYVSDAVRAENIGLASRLDQLITLLQLHLPELAQRVVVLDSGEMVGALTPALDYQLGLIMAGKERGR